MPATQIENLKIIGIEVRTSNLNNQAAQDLAVLWGRFFNETIIEKIPNKINQHIYAIYTDYEGNYKQPYTAVLGVAVSDLNKIPDGLTGREFPSESFKIFTAKGKMPDAVAASWTDIWNRDTELERKYSYDFERYDDKSQQGDESEVQIYLALNS